MIWGHKDYEWHRWFAWRPVRVGGSEVREPYHWAWLEWLERKKHFGLDAISMLANYIYRDITKGD